MKPEFLDDVSEFLSRLKKDSEKLKGNLPFEDLMRGLSDGSVDFRWSFGGRFSPHTDPIKKPPWLKLRYILSAPVIYAMIVPLLFIDLSVSIYQAICFRLWKVPQVKRSQHVVIDRHRLEYLNPFERIHCAYCGYANGVFSYARMVAGETERFWCPVKHESDVPVPHNFYLEFSDYDDADAWNARHTTGLSHWNNDN